MITDAALQVAAKEASLALAETLGTGQQATAALQPQQVLYTQNEPSVPP